MHALVGGDDAGAAVLDPEAEVGGIHGEVEPLLAFAPGPFGLNGTGGIADDVGRAIDGAAGAVNGAVAVVPEGVVESAVAGDGTQVLAVTDGLPGFTHGLHLWADGGPGLGPVLLRGLAGGGRMLSGKDGMSPSL